VSEPSGQDAWNHGDVSPQINTTWLGLIGPGVVNEGVNNTVWSDHTDIQPTMLALLGLHDDYTPDGVVLSQVLTARALPPAMRGDRALLVQLAGVYTQLEAAVGEFGLSTLKASTRALASDSPGDSTYTAIEAELTELGAARDALAARMQAALLGAEFGGTPVSGPTALELIARGQALLARAALLALS
jgi:hypothetical protein